VIAFIHLAKDRRFHIALIKTDGTRMKVLPGTGRGDESPTFSPDGRLLAFASTDGNIYVTDFMGTSVVRVTDTGGFTEPCWSPLME
jgi:Tol biopolymer transport system component